MDEKFLISPNAVCIQIVYLLKKLQVLVRGGGDSLLVCSGLTGNQRVSSGNVGTVILMSFRIFLLVSYMIVYLD